MKCPKCGYLGFDHVDRCRNCGYEFALAREIGTAPELPLRPAPKTEAFPDLSLTELVETREPEPASPIVPRVVETGPPSSAAEGPADDALPLFGGPITDDVPLITRPSPPRPPLAVRRSTPEVPRLRAEPARTPPSDLRLDLQIPEPAVASIDPMARANAVRWPQPVEEADEDARMGARLLAVFVDVAVLALVDAIVVYFTMQICGLTLADLDILPKAPLFAFLAVQNGGYLVAFTAGGQTLGKMIAGIRVVTAGSGASLDIGRAAMRTLMWVLLAVPAGLGFLSAVFSADHRGLHDRIAGSRVVRVSA